MKKMLHFFSALVLSLLLINQTTHAQCVLSAVQYPSGTITPTTGWTTVSTNIYAGEYSAYNVVAGNIYEWSLCATDGGNSSYDSQLTLFNSTNANTAIDYQDDICGDDAKITWTATFTGIAYVQVNLYNCLTNQTPTTLVCRFTPGSTGNPPANDNCISATTVGVGSFCSGVAGTLTNATGSVTPAACTGTNTDDVWYRFVSDGSQVINFECTPNGPGFDPVMQVFLGNNCNSLSELACVDLTLDGQAEVWGIDGASAGQVVYVRIFDYYSAPAVNPNFTFCVYSGSTPSIPGDLCETAIELPTTTSCTNPTSGNFGAFNSDAGFGFDCLGQIASDAWYTFTSLSDSVFFDITPFGSTNPIAEVYEGPNCASLTNLGCGDFETEGFTESLVIAPTVAGTRYYVRLYDGSGNIALNQNYDFCVYDSFGSGAVNDDCFFSTVIEAGVSCSPVTSTLTGATGSTPASQCGGINTDDVWFELIASDTAMIIQMAPGTLAMDLSAEIFYSTTGDCSGIVSFGCANDSLAGEGELLYITGIQPGESLWMRVYDTGAAPLADGTFYLCAWFDPAIFGGGNDECSGATVIQAGQICSPIQSTLIGATQSLPLTTCAGTNTDDVWFEIVAADTAFTFELQSLGVNLDAVAEFFFSPTGTCSDLVSFGCLDETANGGAETVDITGLMPGMSIWVRVYDYFSAAVVDPDFTVCAYWNPDQIFDNDECLGAVSLNTGTTCNPVAFSVSNATGSLPTSSCSPGGLVQADVWFSFVAQSTAARINVAAVNGSDPVIQYFSGACGNLVSRGCSDFFIEGFDENLTATGLIIGQTYFVRVYDYRGTASPATDFTICVTDLSTPTNDNCAGAIQLPTLPAGESTYTYYTTALATQSQAGCSGNANDDVWFSFVAGQNPAGTTIEVGGDLDFASVFQVFSGSCGNLVPVQCVNAVTTGAYDTESQLFTALTAGQTYFVRVYDFDASVTNSTFYIRVTGTPAPCNIQNPVAAAQGNTTICSNSFVNLLTPTVTGYAYQWQFNGAPITGATGSVYAASNAGNYTVQITDLQGCTAVSNSVTVNVNIAPVVTLEINPAQTCVGASVELTGGTPSGGLYEGNNVSNNTFVSINAGSFPVTYSYTDPNGCISTASDVIQAVICTGIELAEGAIRVYPNPTRSELWIELDANAEISRVSLFDLSGRVIMDQSILGSNKTLLNLDKVAPGIYQIQVMDSSNNKAVKKIVVSE
jgi:hypothetical protein